MKRTYAWLFLLLLAPLLAQAAPQNDYNEGIDYQLLARPVPPASNEGVEVVELFWYGCPHCYHFEPHLKSWLKRKPAKVNFIRIPAIFNNEQWRLHATAFYTAEALGKGEQIHAPFFDAIHEKKRQLRTEGEIMAFFAEHGISNEEFRNTFNSFDVVRKVKRAADLTKKYEINGVPSLIVNGKYRTDGPMATNYENLIKILDHLVRKELKQQRGEMGAVNR